MKVVRQMTDTDGRTAYLTDGCIEMSTPDSSSVARWAWLHRTQSLYVAYRDRNDGERQYRYSDVPFSVVAQLMSCESVGKTINEIVKGTYEYERC